MCCVRTLASPFVFAVGLLVSSAVFAADIKVVLDQAKIERLPERVGTLVVGNPLIADVAVQPGNLVVITGKGYGTTNFIALDRSGAVLMERSIEVSGPGGALVVVYRGVERESYSCTPDCERRITLGDSGPFFDANLTQIGSRNASAAGAPVK